MTTLNEIWTERELVEKLGLPGNIEGRSRVLSGWIREGLPCITKGGRRYFVDEDVTRFLLKDKESRTS